MSIYIRTKPTNHKQFCPYCSAKFAKGDDQIVYETSTFYRWTDYHYYHSECAIVMQLENAKFVNHFSLKYHRELNAETFEEVFNLGKWRNWTAHYITRPFEIYRIMQSKHNAGKEWLEQVFKQLIFGKVFNNGS